MKSAASLLAASAVLALAAVNGQSVAAAPKQGETVDRAGPAGDYPMVLGDPFVIDGVTYSPADTYNYDAVGYAGAVTGAGVSGAHRTLPLPSYVEVTSLDSGRTILVRIDQRGPMAGARLIDLSPAAWEQLGLGTGATAPVRVRRVNPPEPERRLLRSGEKAPARMDTPAGLLSVLRRKMNIGPVLPVATAAAAVPTAAASSATAPSPPAAPKPAVVAKPTAAPKPAQAVAAPAKATPAPASASRGGTFVQAAAFSTRERADAAAKALGGAVTQAGRFWRVRTGPYGTRAQADAALAKVRAAGYADARILREP